MDSHDKHSPQLHLLDGPSVLPPSKEHRSQTIHTTMGVKEIRTAIKVDLDKPAWEQPGLHVRPSQCGTGTNALMLLSLPLESVASRQ